MTAKTLVAQTADSRRRTGWVIALASTVCFSVAPTLASAGIRQGIAPVTLLTLRLTITTALLALTILATDPSLLRITVRGLVVCLLGGLSNGLGMLAFFWSLTRINSSIASMIFSVSPLVTLVLLALRGERFTNRNTIRLALGLTGLYLLIGPGGRVEIIGALLAVVSVFTVPVITVLMQWYLSEYDSRTVTLYTVGTMAGVAAMGWLISGAEWHGLNLQNWTLAIVLAVSTYLARLLMFVGIQRIGGGQVGLLTPLETLLTVIWSVTFLRDELALLQWVGGILIIVSAMLAVQRLGRVNWGRLKAKTHSREDTPGNSS